LAEVFHFGDRSCNNWPSVDDGNNIHLGISGFTALSAGFCYAIIPATNRATDEGNKKKFDILHKLSVWLTVAMLIANIAFLFV
jgi:hypothetical protein